MSEKASMAAKVSAFLALSFHRNGVRVMIVFQGYTLVSTIIEVSVILHHRVDDTYDMTPLQ